jgi:hypothetical protein
MDIFLINSITWVLEEEVYMSCSELQGWLQVDFGAISAEDGYGWSIQSISSESHILGLVDILFLLRSGGEGRALDNVTNSGY